MLNLPKSLGPILFHLKTAMTAVARWWETMSDADKRETRQRALTIGACAAVFAFGGPLVAQRFGAQKAQETYITNAAVLAESLIEEERYAEATTSGVQLGIFSNSADPDALAHTASYIGGASASAGGLTLRARDSASLQGLVDFTIDDLGLHGGDDAELDCLSEAVYYEARSEDTIGQIAVAEVVMNRVANPHYPKTVCGVVFQGQYRQTGCQFTFTCDGSRAARPRGESWDRARAIALHVLLGLNTPMTGKATHYHTDYVNPYWAAGLVETGVIGTHIFYRFPKTSKEWGTARLALAAQDAENQALDPMIMADGMDIMGADADPLDPSAALASSLLVSVDPADVALVAPAPTAETDGSAL